MDGKKIRDWTLGEVRDYCSMNMGCNNCVFATDNSTCGLTATAPGEWELPVLSSAEKAVLKALGAKWVTRDKYYCNKPGSIRLWGGEKPPNVFKEGGDVYFNGDNAIGAICDVNLFERVESGKCVEVK